jgi:hypothetical protein
VSDEAGVITYDLYDDPRRIAEEVVRALRVALVTAIARDPSRITAELMVRFVATDLQAREEPPVQDVPIVHYAGGGYGCWMDMRVDDPAVVLCCDGPVRPFYETGAAVTPLVGQGHDYGSAVAFPGGRVSATDQPTTPPNAAGEFLVGAADGSAAVVCRGAGITSPAEAGTVVVQAAGTSASLLLGSTTASFPPALASLVDANISALNSAIQGIPPTGNPITQPLLTALQAAVLAWFTALQDTADAKARFDGPAL